MAKESLQQKRARRKAQGLSNPKKDRSARRKANLNVRQYVREKLLHPSSLSKEEGEKIYQARRKQIAREVKQVGWWKRVYYWLKRIWLRVK